MVSQPSRKIQFFRFPGNVMSGLIAFLHFFDSGVSRTISDDDDDSANEDGSKKADSC